MDISYPDPPLGNHRVRLRPWDAADADALVAAWADPAIQVGCAVPENRSAADATRWISNHQRRTDSGLAIDLVVTSADPGEGAGEVYGEVGFGPVDLERRAAMLGFWVAPDVRGDGVASEAVGLMLDWIFVRGAAVVLAQTTLENPGSIGVLRRAGFELRTEQGSDQTWMKEAPEFPGTRRC